MNNLQETVNEFLDEFYPNNAVQKYRWKKRLIRDPSKLKGSDLAMYNLMLFASRRKGGEIEDIKPLSINVMPSQRIYTGSLMAGKSLDPVSTTIDELKTNYKKVCKNFKPCVNKWVEENKHVEKYPELRNSFQRFKKKHYHKKVSYYTELYNDLYDEDDEDIDGQLNEIEEKNITNYLDTLYDRLLNNLPLVSCNNQTAGGTKRFYSEQELNDYMKETLLKADELRYKGSSVEYYRIKQWIDENHKPMIKQLNDKIKNFKNK